jgi:hypothetical protein
MTDINPSNDPEAMLEGLRELLGLGPDEPITVHETTVITEPPAAEPVSTDEPHCIAGAVEGGPEPVVVEAVAEAVAEADDDSVIEKAGHAIARPVHALGRGIKGFYNTTEAKVRRTNDIRRGRRVMSDASRKMMRQLGEQHRAAESVKTEA